MKFYASLVLLGFLGLIDKRNIRHLLLIASMMWIAMFSSDNAVNAQNTGIWLDIGDLQNIYSNDGAVPEVSAENIPLQWPAILRHSGHTRAEGFWIGAKDWTDANGQVFPYFTVRNGPRLLPSQNQFIPVEQKLISKWEDTEVFINGAFDYARIAIIDEVDPNLPSDRILYTRFRTVLGIDVEQYVYAFSNAYQDDYHLIKRRFVNTGNTDLDDEVELPGQSLHDVLFFNIWHWAGRLQAASHHSDLQTQGKFNMIDVVGDGNEVYPVDFTAIYSWAGFDPDFSNGWDPIGSPMLVKNMYSAERDTIGRLAGMSMQGIAVLHADNSSTDATYDPSIQPKTLGFIDMLDPLTADGLPEHDYYEIGMLTSENPEIFPGGSSRMFPHYADRVEPAGAFWNPVYDASMGKNSGHGATIAYGPYTLAPGEEITTVEALAVGGISYEAATEVGIAYKQSGFDDNMPIAFDANDDGVINTLPFDYRVFDNGSEVLTKNQWFFTARDSLFKSMMRARAAWVASDGMTRYPIVQPPVPPRFFFVNALTDRIEMTWETIPGQPNPFSWEIYRTEYDADNLPYELIAILPGSARRYDDVHFIRGVDYFYYLVAVGLPNAIDPNGITGTPGGLPLKSSRYYTQTYTPIKVMEHVAIEPIDDTLPEAFSLHQNYPNPFNPSTVIRYDIVVPGHVTLSIYNAIGQEVELVVYGHHIPGRYEAIWNAGSTSSGLYLVKLQSQGVVLTEKMLLLR